MRHISRCLNPKLIEMQKNTLKIEIINVKLREYLPEIIRDYCCAGSFNRGCLNLLVNDPAWANQLRYLLPELRDKLRTEAGMYQLSSIKITLKLEETKTIIKSPHSSHISQKARDVIGNASESCQYPPLKKALKQLATKRS